MPEQRRRSSWGRVYQRRSRWYVKFHWPRGGPAHRRAAADTEEDALDILRAVRRALVGGVPLRDVMAEFFGEGVAATITFREAIPQYIKDARIRKRPKTMAGEEPKLRRLSNADWAGLALVDIHGGDIEDWLLELQEDDNLAGSTINRWASAASAVFRWAAKKRVTPHYFNPAREVQRFPESSGREVYLVPEELEAWIDGASDEFRTMARYYARTGVRRDEGRLLQWHSLDLRRGVVKVEADLSKNHKAREIKLTPDLHEALAQLRARFGTAVQPDGDQYVFEWSGEAWSPYRVRKEFKAAVEAAGDRIEVAKAEMLRLHDIRHTVGGILASNGVSLEVIAKILGHKSLETTRRYAHLHPDVISKAADVLAGAIPARQPDEVAEHNGVPLLVPLLSRSWPA